jgi:hypothetical protein
MSNDTKQALIAALVIAGPWVLVFTLTWLLQSLGV